MADVVEVCLCNRVAIDAFLSEGASYVVGWFFDPAPSAVYFEGRCLDDVLSEVESVGYEVAESEPVRLEYSPRGLSFFIAKRGKRFRVPRWLGAATNRCRGVFDPLPCEDLLRVQSEG